MAKFVSTVTIAAVCDGGAELLVDRDLEIPGPAYSLVRFTKGEDHNFDPPRKVLAAVQLVWAKTLGHVTHEDDPEAEERAKNNLLKMLQRQLKEVA